MKRLIAIIASAAISLVTVSALADSVMPSVLKSPMKDFVAKVCGPAITANRNDTPNLDQLAKDPTTVGLDYSGFRPNTQEFLKGFAQSIASYKGSLYYSYQLLSMGISAQVDDVRNKWLSGNLVCDDIDSDYRGIMDSLEKNAGACPTCAKANFFGSSNYASYNAAMYAKVNAADKLFDAMRAEGYPSAAQKAMLEYAIATANYIHEKTPDTAKNEADTFPPAPADGVTPAARAIRKQIEARDKIIVELKAKLARLNTSAK